jgi:hypothetical protein
MPGLSRGQRFLEARASDSEYPHSLFSLAQTNAPRLPAPHRTQADIKSAGWRVVARGSCYWHQMFDQAWVLCSMAQWNPDCRNSVGQCGVKPVRGCIVWTYKHTQQQIKTILVLSLTLNAFLKY